MGKQKAKYKKGMIPYVRREMSKMFKSTKGKTARKKKMRAIWKKAKKKYRIK